MPKIVKIIMLSIFAALLVMFGLYIGLAIYYSDGFSYGTYINGIYCTGKSISQVSEELNDSFKERVAIVDAGDKTYSIDLDKIGYSYDFERPLKAYLDNQNSYLWIMNLSSAKSGQILNPYGEYDEALLKNEVDSMKLEKLSEPHSVLLSLSEDAGYVLHDGKIRIADTDASYKYIADSLKNGQMAIVLDDSCYTSIPYSESEKLLIDLYNSVSEFQNRDYSYDFGDERVRLSQYTLASMLTVDEDGYPQIQRDGDGIILDEENVEQSLEKAFVPFETYNNHDFVTHDGTKIHLDSGTWGNKVNLSAEVKYFTDEVKNGTDAFEREPEYSVLKGGSGSEDIGNTYIEVDIDNQHMYYFENGSLKLETDVVTGKLSTKQGTPRGVYYIYSKKSPAVLKGPGYAEHVKFWMPIYKGIGIHDSSWRVDYGGDIYKSGGSHGCINTPKDKVGELYEYVEVGTPVIVY